MREHPSVWLLLADTRRARLLSAQRTRHDRPHLEELAALEFDYVAGEHGRPSPRAHKDGHSYASRGHEQEEMVSQFAREVAAFAETKLDELSLPRLHLFAAPKFLGALRKALGGKLDGRLVEHGQELISLPDARLAAHPAIGRLMEA